MTLKVKWIDSGRSPQNPTNPDYPAGVDLDVTGGSRPSCRTDLPYPALRIGLYRVTCPECGWQGVCTTAGRADDPRSITVPCKQREMAEAA